MRQSHRYFGDDVVRERHLSCGPPKTEFLQNLNFFHQTPTGKTFEHEHQTFKDLDELLGVKV